MSKTAATITTYDPPPPGKKLIFRPWRRDPVTGEIRWAKWYGLRAFAMFVDE